LVDIPSLQYVLTVLSSVLSIAIKEMLRDRIQVLNISDSASGKGNIYLNMK
jgi:hypothetical protein